MEKSFKRTRYLETVKLTDDGGVVKKVIRQGELGESSVPVPGQEIMIAYEARLDDEKGAIVDHHRPHAQPGDEGLRLAVGLGNVIDGWDMGLLSMGLGEKCDLFLTSKYAFGDEGRPPKIPGKASVVFRIELLEIQGKKSSKPMVIEQTDEQLLEDAKKRKTEGDAKFKDKDYDGAASIYRDTIDLLDMMEKQDAQEYKDLKISVHQNLAMTLNLLEEYAEAIHNCDLALILNDKAAKALYIKSQSYSKQQDLERALRFLK